MLQRNTVEESTLGLLKEIQKISLFKDTRLVGGTALALQLGHRFSIDLDFFGTFNASGKEIFEALQNEDLTISHDYESRNINQFTVNDVKVDTVNYRYNWLEPAIVDEGIIMASKKDIAAMKLAAITGRGTRKDFVDLYFLLQHFSLQQMLDLYMQKYPDGTEFNVLRSLTYFVDAEKIPMPTMFIKTEWNTVKSTIREAVANL